MRQLRTDAHAHAPKKQRRWPRIVLIIFVAIAGIYTPYRYVLNRRVASKIDAIRKQGYPVTLDELDKWYQTPPAGENASDIYLKAFKLMLADTKFRDEVPIIGRLQLPSRGEVLDASPRQAIAQYLTDHKEALRLLHQATGKKRCRYPIELKRGYGTRLRHLDQIKDAACLLALEAAQNADTNDAPATCESILACLSLARSLNDEPLLLSQAVRIGHEGTAISLLERGLSLVDFSDGQLARLGDAFSEFDDLHGSKRAAAGERTLGLCTFEEPLFTANEVGMLAEWQNPRGRLMLFSYRAAGLWALDEFCYLDVMASFSNTMEVPASRMINAAAAVEEKVDNLPPYCLLSSSIPPSTGLLRMDLRRLARMRCAVAGIAVERFSVRHGKLPSSLDELVPTFLDSVPRDPFDEKALRYRKLGGDAEGYVVYSVGEDSIDNGGVERKARDGTAQAGTDITFTVEP
jgi:hypothetical protein